MTRLKLYSWNVNGIRAVHRKGMLEPFVADHRPDILCLQETKAERDQSEVDLSDYEEYWNSAKQKGYSGTAIFSRAKPLIVSYDFTDGINRKYNFIDHQNRDAATEGRVITAEYDKYYVVTVYTPNAKDDLSRIPLRHKQWDPAFLDYCLQLEQKKPVIFCGDFNVAHTEADLARPKENMGKKGFTAEERAGFDNYLKAGFVDTLRLFHQGNGYYTWWTFWANARARNVGWRIDYILVSAALKKNVKSAEIHPEVMGSDHCPVSITLEI